MNLDMMLGLPRSGVIILKKKDGVLVSYTSSMASELQSLYSLFEGQRGITLEVCSANSDIETLRLHTEYYRRLYKDGTHSRKAIQYRVRMVASPDLKSMDVELVTARGDGKVVGRFKDRLLAKDFIETYYGTDNSLCFPVYAANSATKEFLQREQKKMLDIK